MVKNSSNSSGNATSSTKQPHGNSAETSNNFFADTPAGLQTPVPRRKPFRGSENDQRTASVASTGSSLQLQAENEAADDEPDNRMSQRESRVDSGSVDVGTPSLELSPKSPLEVLDEALSSVMRPVAPPRTTKLQSATR